MTYFILTSRVKSGNSLQEAVEQIADKIDHRQTSDPDKLKDEINDQVSALNTQHPRCRPVDMATDRRHHVTSNDSDFSIYLKSNNWYLFIHFHAIKGEATL